ncbi:MAG TPA: ATP-binding protein [Gemmatimonadaceae bacterium]|nr:ATP-binding protein [Gemmatimonadaceae bacterium]
MDRPESAPTIQELHAALAKAEARYDALVRRAGYGIYRSSAQGRFIEANPTLAEMLGYTSVEELLSLEMSRDVDLDPDERARLLRRPATVRGYPEWFETRWKRRDGSPITVRLSVRAEFDAHGEIEFFDGIVEDVTGRQRQDELLRRTERMATIGTTLAGVAHELNNPLAAIMGFSQLLLKKPWPAEDRAALETIHHEAIRSATIVKDLLAMARKRDVERRSRTDVNDVVGYIVRTRRYSLETAGIAFQLELDPTLPIIYGDRAQLEQVILNLIDNAEHALRPRLDRPKSTSGGHIRIRTRHDERDVIIEVEDNGPGIPEAVRSKIWDPFWTTKDEGEGTGLGLAVVHGIIVEHGGAITMENAPFSGARFVIRLPIAFEPPLPEPTSQASKALDVLVVDPAASDLLFIERFLTSRGHAVINAANGDLALRLAEQTSFDAVVCDAGLLARDGTPVAALLRTTSGCRHARFVISTEESFDEQPLPQLDGTMLVARPYDVEELRRLVEGD